MHQPEKPLETDKKNSVRHIEVVMTWRGTVLGVEHLREPGSILIGNGEKATFQVPHASLETSDFELVSSSEKEALLYIAPWMIARVNGVLTGADRIVLEEGGEVVVEIGLFTFAIRVVWAQRVLPFQILQNFDRSYTTILALLAILQFVFLLLIGLMPEMPSNQDDLFLNPEIFREVVVKNEVKREKRKEDLSGKKGARHKDDEGLFGKKELPKEDKLASKKGAPIVDKNKREEDRKIAMNMLSKLGLDKEVSRSSMLGPGGVGSGINEALGGLRGQASGTAGGRGGMGTRGTGSGGGGNALGIGGLGSGTGRGSGGMGDIDLGGQGKSRVRIQPGAVTYEGSLTREEIQRVVDRFMAQIKYCYEREFQKSPDLEGKLLANWTISPEGSVEVSSMLQNTMGNPTVEKCVLRVVNRMVFPKPRGGGIVKVNYPFVFSSAGA